MAGTALPRGNATGPCSWPVSYAGCSTSFFAGLDEDGDGQPDPTDAADQALFEELATTYLWEWTGRRYGLCDELIRPCRQNCDQMPTFFMESPYIRAYGLVSGMGAGIGGLGGWLPVFMAAGMPAFLVCGDCGQSDGCGCGFVSSIRLPGPVSSVTEITIEDTVLDPSAYRLDGSKIVRVDGGRWPVCQDFSKQPGEENTWTIAYQRGLAVPMGGQVAAGVLASELGKAACGDSSCMLPQRVQTITRQGVTMAMLDDFTKSLDKGYTGIWVVDSWISSVTAPPKSALVVSPDFRRPGRY